MDPIKDVKCFKCHEKSDLEDYQIKTLSNGRHQAIGKCKCGANRSRFVSVKKEGKVNPDLSHQ